jgi:hypothetical protein
MQSLGFMVKYLRWVPHSPIATKKAQCVALSNELLHELRSIKHHDWQFIITLDEFLFYLATDNEQIWLRPEQQLPEKPKHTIQAQKMMLTIEWNPLRFHLLDTLPNGRALNVKYYRGNIFTALISLRLQVDERKFVIHANNAKPHTPQKCRSLSVENGLMLVSR